MRLDIYELTMRAVLGLELTDEERVLFQRRNAKYELVRYIYIEKMKAEKSGLVDFHFTPNDETFMNTPTIDIVNQLLKMNESIKNGDYEVISFGDRKDNPPHSGRVKQILSVD